MDTIATIGHINSSLAYTDRATVKVLVRDGDTILLLNQGLIPGGGVEPGESDHDAITRELMEELGITVKDTRPIGTVVQYRNLLKKKYIVNGYVATLDTTGGKTNPQDESEAQFTKRWLKPGDALELLKGSIEEASGQRMDSDANQGRLYNLMTTYELLKRLNP